MLYLLDSDTFIQSANGFYDFDVFPKFWDWLDTSNKAGRVYSLFKVQEELLKKQDRLSQWAKARGRNFFIKADKRATPYLRRVADWAYHSAFSDFAKTDFCSKADFFLVAYALYLRATVVTMEKHPQAQAVIKIPTVCAALSVPCINLFDLLKNEGFKA